MSEPRQIGEVMRDYILHSDDEFAKGLRRLIKENNSTLFGLNEEDKTGQEDGQDDQ